MIEPLKRAPPSGARLALGVVGVLILAWVGMVAMQIALSLLLSLLGLGTPTQLANEPAVLAVAQLFGFLPSIHLAAQLAEKGAPPREPDPRAPPIGAPVLLSVFFAGCALQFVLGAATQAVGDLLPFIAPAPELLRRLEEALRIDSYPRAVAIPFSVVFVAPLTEELLFRGALLPILTQRLGFRAGLGVSALLFGLFHVHPFAILYATLAGLVLGAVAHRSRSILPSFTLHAGFNAIPILLPASVVPIPGFNTGEMDTRLPLQLLASTSLLLLGSLLAFARLTEPVPATRRR